MKIKILAILSIVIAFALVFGWTGVSSNSTPPCGSCGFYGETLTPTPTVCESCGFYGTVPPPTVKIEPTESWKVTMTPFPRPCKKAVCIIKNK